MTADPLAALAESWREMWDVSRQPGPAGFEQEAARALTAWRAGRFELPDYYLVLAREAAEPGPDTHLGPLRSARARRVVPVPDAEAAQQAAGVLHALGWLRRPLVATPQRGHRDGPEVLPGQPGRRQCRPGGRARRVP